MNDLRYAIRQLLKQPGFAAVAVVTLVLGLGANLALFTVLYDQFFRPRALQKPEQIWAVRLLDPARGPRSLPLTAALYDVLRASARPFERLTRLSSGQGKMRVAEGWEPVEVLFASGNYFDFLGVRPQLGRGFVEEEDHPQVEHPVVVISHSLWQRQFGGDAAVVGKTLAFKGEYPESAILEIVGVAPQGFLGLGSIPRDLIMPMSMERKFKIPGSYTVFGRLPQGLSPESAAAALNPSIQQAMRTQSTGADTNKSGGEETQLPRLRLSRGGFGSQSRAHALESIRELVKGNALAATASMLILAISVSNLATLLLARGLSRRREMATLLALGATRWALVRRNLIEGAVISVLGLAAALVVASHSTRFVPAFLSTIGSSSEIPMNLQPDPRILFVAFVFALSAGLVGSLIPAIITSRLEPMSNMRQTTDLAGVPRGAWSWQKALVIGQIGGSLVMISSVLLCLRAVRAQLERNVGFSTDHLLVAQADIEGLANSRFQRSEGEFREQYVKYLAATAPMICEQVRQRLASLPGVKTVGVMGRPPFVREPTEVVTSRLEGHLGIPSRFWMDHVGPDAFRSLGLSVLRGRELNVQDLLSSRSVALVNERFVELFWPDGNPLGRKVYDESWNQAYEVVGVVRNAHLESPAEPPLPTVFFGGLFAALRPSFLLTTTATPSSYIRSVSAALVEEDPWLRGSRIATIRQLLEARFSQERRVTRLLVEMAGLAILLTGLGSYSLMACIVTRRTRELGIRMAVGATRSSILVLVLRSGSRLAATGLMVGLPIAIGASLLLRYYVAFVGPFDVAAFTMAGLGVWLLMLLATSLPACRAIQIDPMETLRHD